MRHYAVRRMEGARPSNFGNIFKVTFYALYVFAKNNLRALILPHLHDMLHAKQNILPCLNIFFAIEIIKTLLSCLLVLLVDGRVRKSFHTIL